jgi:eukaryotic-like serine/threonine-protein kinase
MATSLRSDIVEPGTRVGRFEVVRRLASGATSEIYLARLGGIGGFEKQVVLKRLLPWVAHEPRLKALFLTEARLAGALNHANLVQTLDLVHDRRGYWLAREYVVGTDVGRLLARTPGAGCPLRVALKIAVGTCAGLHFAHEQGVVHRNLTPDNILVSSSGCVKLIDFGAPGGSRPTIPPRGEPSPRWAAYVAPEQWRGEPSGPRSDLFALGSILFEMLAGRSAFAGSTARQTVANICSGTAQARARGVPQPIAAVLRRCLEPNPHERYRSAQAVQIALERFAGTTGLSLATDHLANFVASAGGARQRARAARHAGDERDAGEILAVEQPLEMTRIFRRTRRSSTAGALTG